MPKVFISYSRANLNQVLELEQSLLARGVEVWRDQHSIRGGEQWPKAIGEALATCDAVLLAWSANSANTAAVEFEWNTALALGKKIIPWMLDETPLPASLKTFNWIKEPDTASAVARILQALPDSAPTDAAIEEQVITKLASIKTVEERDVLAQAKALFNQISSAENVHQSGDRNASVIGHKNFTITGDNNIQSSGGVTINESRHQIPLIVAALAVVVIIVLAAFHFASRAIPSPAQPSPSPTVAETTYLRGLVNDERDNPLPGATVKVDEITGAEPMWGTTDSNGGFYVEKIPGHRGDRVRVYISKAGYASMKGAAEYDEYVALPGPLPTVKLKRKK